MIVPLVAVFLLYPSWSVTANEYDQVSDLDYYKTPYDGDMDKRAGYTYKTSQGKRLPVYDFGLGKRDTGGRLYSFGLGKRDFYELEDDIDDLESNDKGKRMKPYGFGLGKRVAPSPYNFGLGKRRDGKLYSFGLGKRSYPSYDYENYLSDDDYYPDEKRSGHRFSFGLGKRDINKDLLDLIRKEELSGRSARSMHYNFGLGKRSDLETVASQAPSSHLRR